MSRAETVSVAMAVYNGARFLDQQLDSIAAQSRLPDELVVADDASTDDSPAILARFAARAPFPVRIVRHASNFGILENFHSAFRRCAGDLIFYCDQDDVWDGRKIETIVGHFTARTMLVTHQSSIVDGDLVPQHRGAPGNPRYGRFAFPSDSATIHGYGHQMAFRRALLEPMHVIGPIADRIERGGLAHDLDRYIPFCASLVGEIVALPVELVRFRRHEAATSPAGGTPPVRGSLTDKARHVIASEAERGAMRLAIVEAAIREGLFGTDTAPILTRAFRARARTANLQRAVLAAHGVDRIRTLAATLCSLLVLGRFRNDRPIRTAMLAVAAAGVSRPERSDPILGPRRRLAP